MTYKDLYTGVEFGCPGNINFFYGEFEDKPTWNCY